MWPLYPRQGPVGVKEDGGGSIRGCGRVGPMAIHRAIFNRDEQEVQRLVEAGGWEVVNEVEAAGCTPLHCAGTKWDQVIHLSATVAGLGLNPDPRIRSGGQ